MLRGPLLRASGVVKDFGGLRPLRLEELSLAPGDVVVVSGLDEQGASVMVDLLTGTALPDRGQVLVDGRSTSSLDDQAEWLAFLEQFGIVNARVVLLDELSVRQNLAVPLTLDLDPLPDAVGGQVEELAHAVGLAPAALDVRLGDTDALAHFRVRVGRAIAHRPSILLAEHPTLGLAAGEVAASARITAGAAARLGNGAVLVLSNDDRFAAEVAGRRFWLTPASGRLSERAPGRGWFSRS